MKKKSHSKNKEFDEEEYKEKIKKILSKNYELGLKKYSLKIFGNHIGDVLKNSKDKVVREVIPRSAQKNMNSKSYTRFQKLLDDKEISYSEIHQMSTSISNTLRPIAGHTFTFWVCNLLNAVFEDEKTPCKAITKGPIKKSLTEKLTKVTKGVSEDLKPDVDIVVYNTNTKKPFLIISCKTTLAERVMQTIRWDEYIKKLPTSTKNIKVFLVSSWEKYGKDTVRARVARLDGVYATNEEVKVGGNIKKFNQIYIDIKKICEPTKK